MSMNGFIMTSIVPSVQEEEDLEREREEQMGMGIHADGLGSGENAADLMEPAVAVGAIETTAATATDTDTDTEAEATETSDVVELVPVRILEGGSAAHDDPKPWNEDEYKFARQKIRGPHPIVSLADACFAFTGTAYDSFYVCPFRNVTFGMQVHALSFA